MTTIHTQPLKPLSLSKPGGFYHALFGTEPKVYLRKLFGRFLFQVMDWPKVYFSAGVKSSHDLSVFFCLFGVVFFFSYIKHRNPEKSRYLDISLIDGDLIFNLWHDPETMTGFKYYAFALFDSLFGRCIEEEVRFSNTHTSYIAMPEGRYPCAVVERFLLVGRKRWFKRRVYRYCLEFKSGLFSHYDGYQLKTFYRLEFDWPYERLSQQEVLVRASLAFLEKRLRSKESLGFKPGPDWSQYIKPWGAY